VESLLGSQGLMIVVAIAGLAGITVCWFGILVSMLVALGNRRWVWGILIFLFGPLFAVPYAFIDGRAEYARALLVRGLLIAFPPIVFMVSRFSLFT